jgi:DNA-binding response OmpR family regulator
MSPKILVVDDEPAMRYTVVFVLMKAGYKVSQARDGEEALSLILRSRKEKEPIDLLLTDIQMPRMSGIELIGELKKRKISLPIFVASGFKDEALTRKLLDNGCSDFLLKPFDLRELVQRIEVVLEERYREKTRTMRSQPAVGEAA